MVVTTWNALSSLLLHRPSSLPPSLSLWARYIFVYIIPSIFSAATKIYLPFAVSRLSRQERKRRRTSLNRDSSCEIRRGEDETRGIPARCSLNSDGGSMKEENGKRRRAKMRARGKLGRKRRTEREREERWTHYK